MGCLRLTNKNTTWPLKRCNLDVLKNTQEIKMEKKHNVLKHICTAWLHFFKTNIHKIIAYAQIILMIPKIFNSGYWSCRAELGRLKSVHEWHFPSPLPLTFQLYTRACIVLLRQKLQQQECRSTGLRYCIQVAKKDWLNLNTC